MSLNDLPPGTRVGDDYTIIEPLARGGMGMVYVALQESTNKRRALKVMTPQPGDPEALRRRFEQEARVSAQIESDHVVQIIGAGVDRDTNLPWLAMELLDGETLDARLERGPLGWMEAWRVIGELCHGLEAAHRLGVVHRDLKPCNVFLARSWRPGAERLVKILDFGIAKRVGDAGQTVGLLGTPLFMAPEQTMPAVALQPSTDVWALGLLVFTILTGSSYWRSAGDSNTQIGAMLREIVLDPLPSATERARELGVVERLPAGFDLWFGRCVVRDPSARFADAGAAYRALEPLFADATRRAEDGYPPIPAAPTMPAFPAVATGAFPAVAPQAAAPFAAPFAQGVMRPMPVDTSGREKESLAPLAYEPSYVEEAPWSEPPSIPKNHIAAKVFGVLLVGSAAAAFAAFTIMRQPDGLSLRPPDERGEAAPVQAAAAVPPAPLVAPSAAAGPTPADATAAPAASSAPSASAPVAEPSAAPSAAAKADPAPKAPPRARAPRRAPRPTPPPAPSPTDVPDTSSDFPYVSGPPGSEPPPASGDTLPPVEDVYPSETPPEPAPAPEPEPAPEPPPADPSPGKFDPGTI